MLLSYLTSGVAVLAVGALVACSASGATRGEGRAARPSEGEAPVPKTGSGGGGPGQAGSPGEARAVFAGGCFWCMQPPFDELPGVLGTRVGYTGGTVPNPTYEQVGTGRTGHTEAIEVRYDPRRVTYGQILEVFWRSIDPTDAGGQFADRGSQYRTAIFYADEAQQREAERSKAALQASGRFARPIAVPIEPAKPFYPAEGYHQRYYQKNPTHYQRYKNGSGRGPFLQRVWGGKNEI